MVIRNRDDDERPIQRVGQVLPNVRVHEDDPSGNGALQEVAEATGRAEDAPVYNVDEEGNELFYLGKLSGKRKLRDSDVARLRRNEERLSVNHWAKIYRVTPAVIWNAMKGYTYKHLNWRIPPIR